jgi:hypothetical protein
VRLGDGTRTVERALESVVFALERALVAAPHALADLKRLFQLLEALGQRRVGEPQSAGLLFVVACADTEPGAAFG